MPAVPVHHTATVDEPWDGEAAVAAMPNDAATLRYCHAWYEADGDPDAKGTWKFPHAKVKGGPANLPACRDGLARVGDADIPDGDRAGVKAHLQAHLDDAKSGTNAADRWPVCAGRTAEGVGVTRSAHVRRLEGRVTRTAGRYVDLAASVGAVVADLPAMKLPWYEIRNAADGTPDETPTVFIFDEIGGSFGVDAKQFAEDLEAIDAPAITVRINSPGGSVFDAIAIFNALNHHPAQITVYVDALAASAASIVAMAGDEIVMMPGAQMMIHDAAATEEGNAADMAKMSTFLDRQSDNVADIYRMRGGGDTTLWRALMVAETWMFGGEAVGFGLADRVEELATSPVPELGDRMTRAFDLAHFRYAGRDGAPAPDRVKAMTTALVPRRAARPAAPEKSSRAQMSGPVRRAYPVQVEVRTAGDGGSSVVEGYASVTEAPYEMWDAFGPYTEVIRSGAFARTLNANPQVQLLLNHGGLSMAYTRAGTLQLSEDSTGLHIRAEVNPVRSDVRDLLTALEDGAVDEMSFAFRVPEGRSIWSPDFDQRDITEVDINRGDVSVVNFGANPSTTAAVMRAQDWDRLDEAAARGLYERLQRRFVAPIPGHAAAPVQTRRLAALSLRELAADDDARIRAVLAV
jgi:HK97 family phage prohead protease